MVPPLPVAWLTTSFAFRPWRLASSRLPVRFSAILTVWVWPALSDTLADPTWTTLCVFRPFARAVTATNLWPLSTSVTVILSASRHVAPAGPVHDTRTLALEPDTFAADTFAWPTKVPGPGAGGVEAVVSVSSAPTNVPKSLVATAR